MIHGSPIRYLQSFKSLNEDNIPNFIYYSSYVLIFLLFALLWSLYDMASLSDWEMAVLAEQGREYEGFKVVLTCLSLIAATAINLEAERKKFAIGFENAAISDGLLEIERASQIFVWGNCIPAGWLLFDNSTQFAISSFIAALFSVIIVIKVFSALLRLGIADEENG